MKKEPAILDAMFGTKRPPKVPEMFANDLSYGRTEEQADMDHLKKK